jgi:hypothetical protein
MAELRIVPSASVPLDADQRAFNELVSRLAQLRARLAEWRTFEDLYRQRVSGRLVPLQRELDAARRDLAVQCDDLLAGRRGGGLSGSAERRNLQAFLRELCLAHLDEAGHDAVVATILERHVPSGQAAGLPYADASDEAAGPAPRDVEGAGEQPSADASGAHPWDEAEEAERLARERRESARRQRQRDRARKRNAARAAREEGAAQPASLSVREVYRKLASVLHPDRAQDDADRARRNLLMQRANAAYESADLLGLLELQLEAEQIDAAHLVGIAADRLRRYNTVLQGQVNDLVRELDEVERSWRQNLPGRPPSVTPRSVERDLKRQLAEVREATDALRRLGQALLDPAFRRDWLEEDARARRAALRAGGFDRRG